MYIMHDYIIIYNIYVYYVSNYQSKTIFDGRIIRVTHDTFKIFIVSYIYIYYVTT